MSIPFFKIALGLLTGASVAYVLARRPTWGTPPVAPWAPPAPIVPQATAPPLTDAPAPFAPQAAAPPLTDAPAPPVPSAPQATAAAPAAPAAWVNISVPSRVPTVHREDGCRFVQRKRESPAKGVGRLKGQGGWLPFPSWDAAQTAYPNATVCTVRGCWDEAAS